MNYLDKIDKKTKEYFKVLESEIPEVDAAKAWYSNLK